MRTLRLGAMGLVVLMAGALAMGAHAGWACVPIATLEVTPAKVQAGQEITISGTRFFGPDPVVVRLGALDGPVLTTVQMPATANTVFKTNVTIPPDTLPGSVVLIVTQDVWEESGGAAWGIPARTVVTVTDASGHAPPPPQADVLARPVDLARGSTSTAALLLVVLGVAAVALIVAGGAALLAARRRSSPVPATPGGQQ